MKRFPAMLFATILVSACTTPFMPVLRDVLPITPADPAMVAEREVLVSGLSELAAEGLVVSGQNIGHAGWDLEAGPMQVGSRAPAVMGLDLGYDDLSGDFSAAIDRLAAHASRGGLVELSFHPPNPVNGGDAWNKTPVDFRALANPDHPLNIAFMGLISNLANILQELENRGVVVFLRLLHEANGGWFWWGNDRSWPLPSDWTALWRQVHHYLREARALDNVAFVYCANVRLSSLSKPVDYYYPGDAFVDVVGLDYYGDDLDQFNANSSLTIAAARGKPLGMGEVGSASHQVAFDQRLWAQLAGSGISSFIVWHSWPGHAVALADCAHGEDLLALPEVLDRDEFAAR